MMYNIVLTYDVPKQHSFACHSLQGLEENDFLINLRLIGARVAYQIPLRFS